MAEYQGSTHMASSATSSQGDSEYKVITGLVKDVKDQSFVGVNPHGGLKTLKEQCAELSDPRSMTREYAEHADHPTDTCTSSLVMDGQSKAQYSRKKPGIQDHCLQREQKRSGKLNCYYVIIITVLLNIGIEVKNRALIQLTFTFQKATNFHWRSFSARTYIKMVLYRCAICLQSCLGLKVVKSHSS